MKSPGGSSRKQKKVLPLSCLQVLNRKDDEASIINDPEKPMVPQGSQAKRTDPKTRQVSFLFCNWAFPRRSAMPESLDNRNKEGRSAMSLAQLRGSTSSANSPGNRTPPHIEKTTGKSAKDRNKKLLNGYTELIFLFWS